MESLIFNTMMNLRQLKNCDDSMWLDMGPDKVAVIALVTVNMMNNIVWASFMSNESQKMLTGVSKEHF